MTTLSIILKKGKRLKYIEWKGIFVTEKTSFGTTITAELHYKLLKDELKKKGWNTYIKNKPVVSSNIEHTKGGTFLGRYVDGEGTVGGKR